METKRRDGGGLDHARVSACDSDFPHLTSSNAGSPLARTSRLAVAACALAGVSLLLAPGLVYICGHKGWPSPFVRITYQYVTYGTAISATVLGLISLARIGLGAGRLVGRGFASIGVAAPAVQWLLLFGLVLLVGPTDFIYTMTCDGNLRNIGSAMRIYANDYEDEFPRAGGPGSQWTGRVPDWKAADRYGAYGLNYRPLGSGGQVSMTASLYLLVKYEEARPRSFICGGRWVSVFDGFRWSARTKEVLEEGITEFTLGSYSAPKNVDLIDFWDFGPNPTRHVSYAYHMVYGPHKLSVSCEPGMAVAADRNPWMDSPSAKASDFSLFKPDMAPFSGSVEQGRYGNTLRHHQDGQNVLFVDGHVGFAKRPWCGFENDNIYTSWDGDDKVRGKPPKVGSTPAGPTDSLLVNDPVRP